MSSLTAETSGPSSSPSISTRARILKSTKGRSVRTGDSSANSITSNETVGDRSQMGLDPSQDSQSTDWSHDGSTHRPDMSKIKSLLPGKRRRERKLRESAALLDQRSAKPDGEDKASSSSNIGEMGSSLDVEKSQDLIDGRKSEGSSLLTEDSDTEE